MKIIVSIEAREQLKHIYHYYVRKASKAVATKMRKRITDKIKTLAYMPMRAPKEPNLEHRAEGFHFLLVGRYKIIFNMKDEQTVFIATIFDTSQDPDSMLDR